MSDAGTEAGRRSIFEFMSANESYGDTSPRIKRGKVDSLTISRSDGVLNFGAARTGISRYTDSLNFAFAPISVGLSFLTSPINNEVRVRKDIYSVRRQSVALLIAGVICLIQWYRTRGPIKDLAAKIRQRAIDPPRDAKSRHGEHMNSPGLTKRMQATARRLSVVSATSLRSPSPDPGRSPKKPCPSSIRLKRPMGQTSPFFAFLPANPQPDRTDTRVS